MTGEECKNMCDDPTNVDEYDRPCVAYEHSSQNASDVANCALAWACESTNTWEGGATYTTGINLTFNAYIGYYSVHISYRLVDICELTILHILEFDCNVLPLSMNGHAAEYGCPGAVWTNGEPSQRYCEGKDNDDNEDAYPWWKQCCEWQNGECIAL